MKRITISVFAALCLLTPLLAAGDLLYGEKLIGFRHRSATAQNGGQIDSSFVQHTGAITDTTQEIVLPDRGFAPYVLGADSLSLFDATVTVRTSGLAVAATDTLYVTLQGSYDGNTWVSAPQIAILESGNGAGLSFFRGYATSRTGSITVAAATTLQMGAFPIHRLITQTSAATVGRIFCSIRYWHPK